MILSFELLLHFMILCLCSCFSPKIPICYFLPTIFPLLAISTLKTSFLVHVPSAPRSCPAFQSHSKWILFCILISVLLDTICLDFCIIVISFVFSTLRFYIYIYKIRLKHEITIIQLFLSIKHKKFLWLNFILQHWMHTLLKINYGLSYLNVILDLDLCISLS